MEVLKGEGNNSVFAEDNHIESIGVETGVSEFDTASATNTLPCFTIRNPNGFCLKGADIYICDASDAQKWKFTGEGLLHHIDSGMTFDSSDGITI